MSSFSPTSAPSVMKLNPSGCQKFIVNVFKAGSGRCRDCGHEWFQHEGVIDKAIADKFRAIWNNDRRSSPVAGVPPLPLQSVNQTPIRTMKDLKEEKRRALLAKRTSKNSEDWFNGGGDSARSSSRKSFDENNESEDEDEFKFYSRDEFLAKESSRSSGLSGGSSTNSKPLKVVNLIEFDQSNTPIKRNSDDGEQQVSVSVLKLEEMESLLRSVQTQLVEKDKIIAELEVRKNDIADTKNESSLQCQITRLECLLQEKDSIANTARAESSRLLDELDRVMLESNRKVRELESLLVERSGDREKLDESVVKQLEEYRVKIQELEKEVGEYKAVQNRMNDVEEVSSIKDRRIEELENILVDKNQEIEKLNSSETKSRREVDECRTRIAELESVHKQSVCEQERFQNRIIELEALQNDLDVKVHASSERVEEMKRVAESQSDEILKLRNELLTSGGECKRLAQELVELKNQRESDTAKWNVESVRLRSEMGLITQKLTDSSEQVRIERNNSIELQGRLIRAEETIENLNERLKRSSDELNNSQRMGDNLDQIRDANEQYLDAIADVAIVLRTACDKYLTPHSSMANSRTHSVEDVGSGVDAIRVLESNVKSALRMIDNVYEKCRYLEKENTKLETNMYDLQLINQGLKDKMNKSFMQRLFEPMLGCGLPGNSSPQSGGAHGHGSPIVRNYLRDNNREMSHLLPPDQVSMLDDPDVH